MDLSEKLRSDVITKKEPHKIKKLYFICILIHIIDYNLNQTIYPEKDHFLSFNLNINNLLK